jgi:hypothetical protein
MADTRAMIAIILHAADRLRQEDPAVAARILVDYSADDDSVKHAITRCRSQTVAMAYAEAVLRMVAACMNTDDEPPESES